MKKVGQRKKLWYNNIWLSANMIHRDTSRIANHKDPPSVLPTVLVSCNPVEEEKWTGGELLLTNGVFQCKYNKDDLVLMNANQEHAVMDIKPEGNARFISRFSLVMYVKAKQWKGDFFIDLPTF